MAPRDRAVVAALAVAAVAACWWRLDTGPSPEVTRFRDDAYYYFSWARSLADGDGPCVTPGVPTSGVQLLWGLVLALAAAVAGPASLPAAAQVLGLALHTATAGAVFWLLRGHRAAAWCGALLYLGNPVLLTEAQNGQETALACFATAMLIGSCRLGERGFAAAALLATLARADLFVMVPFLAIHRDGMSWRAVRVPIVVLVVFFGCNWFVSGSFLPDSAAPIPWLFEQHFQSTSPGVTEHLARLWWWLRPCLLGGWWGTVSPWLTALWVFVACRRLLPGRLRYVPLLATAAGWALGAEDLEVPLCASLLIAFSTDGFENEDLPWLALLCGWATIVFLHLVIRHYPRPYYFAPMGVVGVAAVVVFQARRPRLGATVALLIAALQVLAAREPAAARRWQEESRMAGRYLRELIPPAAPVGCFNAGLVGYLDAGPVINLDGVVNRPAFDALRRGDLDGYLDRHDVSYVLDVPLQFEVDSPWPHASGRHFGPGFEPARDLREVARFDVPGAVGDRPGNDSLRLYARVGRAATPFDPGRSRALGRSPDGGHYVLWTGGGDDELFCDEPGGRRSALVRGEPGVAFVVKVSTRAPGKYTLHTGDRSEPVIVLENP